MQQTRVTAKVTFKKYELRLPKTGYMYPYTGIYVYLQFILYHPIFRWITFICKKDCGKKLQLPVLKYYSSISFDKLRKTTTDVTDCSQYLGWIRPPNTSRQCYRLRQYAG
jgi:hypothetical protein